MCQEGRGRWGGVVRGSEEGLRGRKGYMARAVWGGLEGAGGRDTDLYGR